MKKVLFIAMLLLGNIQVYGINFSTSTTITTWTSMYGFLMWMAMPLEEDLQEAIKARDSRPIIRDICIDTLEINLPYIAVDKIGGLSDWIHCKCRDASTDSVFVFIKREEEMNEEQRIHYRDSRSLTEMVNIYKDGKLTGQDFFFSDILFMSYKLDSAGVRTPVFANDIFKQDQFAKMTRLLESHYDVMLIPYMYHDAYYADNLTYDILAKESPKVRICHMNDTIVATDIKNVKTAMPYRKYFNLLSENKLSDETVIRSNPKIQTLPDGYPLLIVEVNHRDFERNRLRRQFVTSPQTQEVLMIILQHVDY